MKLSVWRIVDVAKTKLFYTFIVLEPIMDIEIRKATISDLKFIQELNHKLFLKEYEEYDKALICDWPFGEEGTEYFKERIEKDNGCALVAVADGKAVGYMVGAILKRERYRNISKFAELENTLVLTEHRSKGIGKKLYEKFKEWCKSKNVQKICVEPTAQNTRAIEFYRKHGFKDYSLVLETDL